MYLNKEIAGRYNTNAYGAKVTPYIAARKGANKESTLQVVINKKNPKITPAPKVPNIKPEMKAGIR